jgi:hypothetical protein
VQVPAQAVLHRASLAHEIVAVVEQELDLALGAGQGGGGKIVLAQGGACDRQCVDRVRLAALAPAAARLAHQPGWNAHNPLTAGKQEALERSQDVAAVLERPQALCRQRACPGKQ